jgi:LysR family transcriptional regulator, hydrogen peroxide-inducible genes activator
MAKVIEDITPVLLDRLQQGTISMALIALPVPGNTHSCLELFEERFHAALPVKHPLANQETIKLNDLKDDPFLVLKDGHCFRDSLIAAACREFRVKPNVVFECSEIGIRRTAK